MDYKEWATIFFKNKDLMKKEIIDIKDTPEGFDLIKKELSEKVYIIGTDKLVVPKSDKKIWIVAESSKEKIKEMMDIWQSLVSIPDLNIIFVNIKNGTKWIINPKTHSKISECTEEGFISIMNNS